MSYQVRVPQLGVNDYEVEIFFERDSGEFVDKGNIIALAETSKATFEIEADHSGYLNWSTNEGKAETGQVIATISEEESEIKKTVDEWTLPERKEDTRIITNSAIEFAKSMGIVIAEIREENISERTVRDFIEERKGELAIYGAGAGGSLMLETLKEIYNVVCYIDDFKKGERNYLPILDPNSAPDAEYIALALSNSEVREKAYLWAKGKYEVINTIEDSLISPHAVLGKGNYIKKGALVDSGTQVGNCCIIDNNTTIPHDNLIGNFVHIAPGTSLGSSVVIGDYTILGIGSSVSTGVKIGKNCIVSVGSSVTFDVPDNSIVEGVPGKIIGKRS